ncbi:cytochrome P450 [Cristinia sonorae]|uniref:Cytochrome P450 n=1 Tax=Cristinia sonorae TaxID=1940300 RepID=A0A8K0UTF3_9AGAR|nr:cytochrome P450 [Cristinia sonorae]
MDGLLVLAVLTVALTVALYRQKPKGPHPPGPPGIPLIGNILPVEFPWETIRRWGKQYGPFIRIRLLGTPAYVINSVEVAIELLEKRSTAYSQRIPMPMIKLSGMDEGGLYETNPTRLRHARRLVASGVSARELESYRPQIRSHINTLLGRFLNTPDRFFDHIFHLPEEILMDITYGYTSKGHGDPFLKEAEKWILNFASASSVSLYLVNWVPMLNLLPGWLPGTGFKHIAAASKKQADDFGEEAYQLALKAGKNGAGKASVVSKAVSSEEPFEKHVIVKSATQMVTGGADTGVSTLQSFMLAMTLNPDIQLKAQEEIDRIVGHDRLPAYTDRPNLPYVDAIFRELMRWRPPVPLVPRSMAQDDVYNGYFVPNGAFVFVNAWAMLHDEDKFPDHDTFNPDRWMDTSITKDKDSLYIGFGFGRRECPGKLLAMELVFTSIANILAVFNVTKARDAHGNLIIPPADYTSGAITAPIPFKCDIKPRSKSALKLLRAPLDDQTT